MENLENKKLIFLVSVVQKELKHLIYTDSTLFHEHLTLAKVALLNSDNTLSEKVEAFISRFGRLQDTVGDKLIPQLLEFLGEKIQSHVDNLDKAERLGFVESSVDWMKMRKLRNVMVHEYIENPDVLCDALNAGHNFVPTLKKCVESIQTDMQKRGILEK